MSAAQNNQWFQEIFSSEGSSFGLKIKGKLAEVQTPYQHIEIYGTETFGNLMVIDGCVMLTTRDNFLYHEMMSHVPLFSHANPQKVVIIGGGDCGTLQECLRHRSVTEVWQIDIDEQVTRLSEKYFPELCTSNNDPRAHISFDDGIKWMKAAKPESFDIIIVDSTDPVGPAEGLFKQDFFENCFKVLKKGGIFIQQSESPLYHMQLIKNMHETLRAVGFSNTHTAPFPQPVYPTGWWSATLAGKGVDLQDFREKDAQQKTFKTRYYNAGIHRASFALPEFMRELG